MTSPRHHSGTGFGPSPGKVSCRDEKPSRSRRYSTDARPKTSSLQSRRRSSRYSEVGSVRELEMHYAEVPEARDYRGNSPPPRYQDIYHCDRVELPPYDSDGRGSSTEEERQRTVRRRARRSHRQQSPRMCYLVDESEIPSHDSNSSDSSETESDRTHRRTSTRGRRCRAMPGRSSCHDSELIINFDNEESVPTGVFRIERDGLTLDYQSLPVATEDEIRKILKEYSRKKICRQNNVHKKCTNISITPSYCYRYKLRTLTESRKTEKKTKPYHAIEGELRQNGKVPDAWDVPVRQPTCFLKDSKTIHKPVPNTSTVINCSTCVASGCSKCTKCSSPLGFKGGKMTCTLCMGTGSDPYGSKPYIDHHYHHPCPDCHGGGLMQCDECKGSGSVCCKSCLGKKKVISYTQLTVTWKSHSAVYTDSFAGVPEEVLHRVPGEEVLSKTEQKLDPIEKEDLLDDKIRQVSKKYLERHNSYPAMKLRQKHTVDIIPINTVRYTYRKKLYTFNLVGTEKEICGKYPSKIDCSIM